MLSYEDHKMLRKTCDTKIFMAFAYKYLSYNPLRVRDSSQEIRNHKNLIVKDFSFFKGTLW